MGVTPSQTIASTFRELDHKQFAKMETPFTFIPDQSPMKAHDRKQDARDSKFSIVTSCWRQVAVQKRGNNDIETQS